MVRSKRVKPLLRLQGGSRQLLVDTPEIEQRAILTDTTVLDLHHGHDLPAHAATGRRNTEEISHVRCFCALANHHRILPFDNSLNGRVPVSQWDQYIPGQVLKSRRVARCPVRETDTDISKPLKIDDFPEMLNISCHLPTLPFLINLKRTCHRLLPFLCLLVSITKMLTLCVMCHVDPGPRIHAML